MTPRTRAIIPVHLYGQAAPVERLMPLADGIGAWVVEDAAQSQGARRNGASAGALGHAAATSFYPGKNLGAYGDAGAALTGSDDLAGADADDPRPWLAAQVRARGASASTAGWTPCRRSFCRRSCGGWPAGTRAGGQPPPATTTCSPRWTRSIRPRTLAGNEHVWHLYVVRVPDRDRVLKELHAAGIGAGIHYPVPIHLTPRVRRPGVRGGLVPGRRADRG